MEPICAEVNLGAIRRNFQALTAILSPQTGIMAVVKADAYGHGAIPVARELLPGRQPAACLARYLGRRRIASCWDHCTRFSVGTD